MVKLQGISAGYGEKTVLQNISMDFPPGTVTAIVGPNGCGKSTLLKTTAGLLPLTAGEIAADEPRARYIAYSPQSRAIPEMTAGRLVLHGRFPWLTWPRRYRAEDEAAARSAMDRLGVAELSDTPLAELSGGTRQKVYLAMALAQGADTLLLDEPTSFLDIGHQLQLMALCRELAAEGKALAVVLHDLPLALGYADLVAVMDAGQLLALDTPGAILSSGLLDRVFGVRVLQIPTPAGMQYVCVPR
jgi:iron complex transport system ATP-binding protein